MYSVEAFNLSTAAKLDKHNRGILDQKYQFFLNSNIDSTLIRFLRTS